jgi:hypothetical protein
MKTNITDPEATTATTPGPVTAPEPDPGGQYFAPSSDESAKAFSAFMAYFNLGPGRNLADTAVATSTSIGTIKAWSVRFHWRRRIQSHNTRVIQRRVEADVEAQAEAAADWDDRTQELRELEWDASRMLIDAAKAHLEALLEKKPGDASFAEICRALETASKLGRLATGLATAREEISTPAGRPLQIEITTALDRIYGPVVDISPKPALPTVGQVSGLPVPGASGPD